MLSNDMVSSYYLFLPDKHRHLSKAIIKTLSIPFCFLLKDLESPINGHLETCEVTLPVVCRMTCKNGGRMFAGIDRHYM